MQLLPRATSAEYKFNISETILGKCSRSVNSAFGLFKVPYSSIFDLSKYSEIEVQTALHCSPFVYQP